MEEMTEAMASILNVGHKDHVRGRTTDPKPLSLSRALHEEKATDGPRAGIDPTSTAPFCRILKTSKHARVLEDSG